MLRSRFDKGKFIKRILWFIVILAVGWVVNLRWFKPFSIELFYERMFYEYSLAHPEFLTQHHAYEKYAFNDYARQLNDVSTERLVKDMEMLIKNWDMLKSYRFSKQTPEQQVSTKVLDFYWEMEVYMQQYDQIMYYSYPINHIDGIHISFVDFMLNTHEIKTLEDAENYLERLGNANEKIRQNINKFEFHTMPPTPIIDKVIAQIEHFVNTDVEKNLIYNDFHRKVNRVRNLPQQAKNELFYELKILIEDDIIPVYKYLLQELDRAKSKALPSAGIWQTEMGEIYYQDLLRQHLTRHHTKMLQVDDLAFEVMDEMAKCGIEFRNMLDSLGFTPEDSLKGIMSKIYADSTQFYASKKKFMKDFKSMMVKNNEEMSHVFDVDIANSLEIREMVLHRKPYTSRFFYYPASLDDYRTAKLYVNTDSLQYLPKFMLPALMHLKVSPGQHFVKTVQHHQKHLPTFRRSVSFDAYIDGWAFYAQKYLSQNGYYQTFEHELGRKYLELVKATVAMTDYYIHKERFERELAIEFIIENTGLPNMEAEAIVDEIIVDPGRAFAYWEGYTKILELQKLAQEKLEERFNIKSFHQAILRCGPVPLEVLEMVVQQYIKEINPSASFEEEDPLAAALAE